ncbi:MAG: DUF3854 domain-containing protein, partial [Actinomycetota bacterium]|nr:DUF3854 domain-containing protein [Actinomycetota bacterium]
MLEVDSAIAGDVIAERGVVSTEGGGELPRGFSTRQRGLGPGMLFTVHRPDERTAPCFRPDTPDPDNPGAKYEMMPKRRPGRKHGGPGNVLDVHPSLRHLIADTSVPVIFTEGLKKADAITTAARAAGVEVLVVAVSGVWNWLSAGEPIEDMLGIPVEGRRVYVWFDSDMLHNRSVQMACERLAEHLIGRGAEVYITYMQDGEDGSKVGADDFLAGGGTLAEARLLSRPYDPSDFALVRLSRSEKLRALVADIDRQIGEMDYPGMAGRSAKELALVYADEAARSGEIHPDGVRVVLSEGTAHLRSRLSTRTVYKSKRRLEEIGFLYRDNADRELGKPGAVVIRAGVRQGESSGERGGEGPRDSVECHRGALHPRGVPRLRWSDPGSRGRRGVIEGDGRVRVSRTPPRPPRKRPGKFRGHLIDALYLAGGTRTVGELYDFLYPGKPQEKRRPRDLVRRRDPDKEKGRDGLLVMLEEEGIISIDGELVSLTPDWRERLDVARRHGGEIEAEETARHRLAIKRAAYREHLRRAEKGEPEHDPAPTEADMDAARVRRELEPAGYIEDLQPLSPLAVAVDAYLRRNPADAMNKPSYIASWTAGYLWSENLVEGKPDRLDVARALDELGGDGY